MDDSENLEFSCGSMTPLTAGYAHPGPNLGIPTFSPHPKRQQRQDSAFSNRDSAAAIPYELLTKAEAILRQRDPEFELPHHPIEICIGDRPKILYRGHLQMRGYHVWVEHGFLPGVPGTEESVSITLGKECDWVAGSASAQLLALR